MKKLLLLLIFSFLGVCQLYAQYDVELDALLFQKVPSRDGINLSANVYKPTEMKAPLPAILVFTPYVANEKVKRAMYFARRGYVFVTADCRGRGHSEGVFTPFEKDGQDAHDIVEWVAKQPWCNGKVGMMGGSYRGMVQWMAMKNFPPHLKSVVPTASVGPGIDFPLTRGIFGKYAAKWLSLVNGNTYNGALFDVSYYWYQKYINSFKKHLPFSDFAKYSGSYDRVFQKWIAHPDFDEYWQSFYPTPKDYQKFNIPILTITGFYDGDQPGALHYYTQHMKHGNPEAKKQHYLIVGPWHHAGTRKPNRSQGRLKFGANSAIDINKLHLDWFDWTLKGKKASKPAFLKDKVAYYEMETNQWRYQSTFKEYSDKNLMLYLHSQNDDFHDTSHPAMLKQQKPSANAAPDTFVYDPLDQSVSKNWRVQASIAKKNYVVYQSKPLKEDVVITGRMVAKLYLEINTKDTDFAWTISEVLPNGDIVFLQKNHKRARYRESLKKAKLITPGTVNLYTFDDTYYLSKKIKKGSSIRFVFRAMDQPNMQHNYNSGKDVSKETAKDAKTCTIKVHHSEKYPSHLILPIDTNQK